MSANISNHPVISAPRINGKSSSLIRLLIASVSCAALLAQMPIAFGAVDDNDKVQFEEILVTATKRGSQTLIDVPIAIQAIGGDMLRDRGVQDFADWAVAITGWH